MVERGCGEELWCERWMRGMREMLDVWVLEGCEVEKLARVC